MHKWAYSLHDFAKSMGGEILACGDTPLISRVSINSRKLESDADETAFIAIKGLRKNAHHYLEDVYDSGVRILVISEEIELSKFSDATIIMVDNGIKALQDFAAFHRDHFQIPIVAITGSNGKTMVKEWAYQLSYQDGLVARSPHSYNSQVGVPLSILKIIEAHEIGFFEVGISQCGEMEKLERVVKPNIGIFTNIGAAHQENFLSLDEKIDEKLKLFEHSDLLIYCRNHERIHQRVCVSHLKEIAQTWGNEPGADLIINTSHSDKNSTTLIGEYLGIQRKISIPFTDNASIEDACHLWLFMLLMKKSDDIIAQRMQSLVTIPMRLETLVGINGCVVINDVYNSDLNALDIALDLLKMQRKNNRFTAIISDIIGSGDQAENLYKAVANLIKAKGVDRFIGIGPEIGQNRKAFEGVEAQFYPSTQAFIQAFSALDFIQENILVKGARPFSFEQITELLQNKSHETVLEIDLNKMLENLNFIKSNLKPETKLMVMVKAFAYGSGSYEVGQFLEYHRADYAAVAYADEGITMRDDGIKLPILVLNPEITGYPQMIKYRLEPQIYNFRTLQKFTEALQTTGITDVPYPIHIKLNTGMNRLGFDPNEMEELGQALSKNPSVKVVSVFSHLSGSDEPDMDTFTSMQFQKFVDAADNLQKELKHSFIRHILNSNGILRHPDFQLDMVRLGIALYGVSSNIESRKNLLPVSKLKTTISQIRKVEADQQVGYSPKSKLASNKTIAVLSIGYADGYPRLMGNGLGRVYINGKYAHTVGNICMDMCMVDVTDIECEEGDSVEVFGNHVDIYEVAEKLKTIPYEVLTNISQRVKRISTQF